jgi:hypothetical protein
MTVMRLPLRTLLGAIGLAAVSLATAADSFTVGVLSCAAETDRDRRLECYDRAVAGYTAALAGGKRDAVAGVAPLPATAAPPLAGSAPLPAKAAPAVAAPAPAAASSAPAVAAAAAEKPAALPPPRHVAARISSIEHFPDHIVVHLDNQQTWKQVSDSPGGPVLRDGDSVTIDKQMGSFWLAGPKGEAIQVRLEAPRP